jgi:hypothetical protein
MCVCKACVRERGFCTVGGTVIVVVVPVMAAVGASSPSSSPPVHVSTAPRLPAAVIVVVESGTAVGAVERMVVVAWFVADGALCNLAAHALHTSWSQVLQLWSATPISKTVLHSSHIMVSDISSLCSSCPLAHRSTLRGAGAQWRRVAHRGFRAAAGSVPPLFPLSSPVVRDGNRRKG